MSLKAGAGEGSQDTKKGIGSHGLHGIPDENKVVILCIITVISTVSS